MRGGKHATLGLLLVSALVGLCALAAPQASVARLAAGRDDLAPLDNEALRASTQNSTPTPVTTTSSKATIGEELAAPEDEPEAATSTVNSLIMDLDETNASMTTVAAPLSASDEATDPSETADSILLEGRSIKSSDTENSVPEASEKLSISHSSAPGGNETDETSKRPALNEGESAVPASARLNMSEVDQVYTRGHKNEQEAAESWHRMDKKLRRGVTNVVGSLVPFALNMSQEAKISSNCSGSMLKWFLSMNHLKAWALRMLDASGKPIAGLLEGSLTMFGNYRECLKIRAPDDDEIEFAGEFREYFRGKYCIIQAKPWLPEKDRFYNLNAKLKALESEVDEEDGEEKAQWYDKTVFDELSEWALAFNYVDIRLDLCVPSLCSREDLQKTINFLLRDIDLKARVLRCEMDSVNEPGFSSIESGSSDIAEALAGAKVMGLVEQHKSVVEPYAQLGWILVPALAIVLVLGATVLSMAQERKYNKNGEEQDGATNKLSHTIKSLSLKRSVSSHLNVDYDQLADDKPLALYGIRFILVLWVILVESAVNLKFEYLRELLMLKDLIFWWPMQFVINSTLQFDSIILLTAFTMAYKNCLIEGANGARMLSKFVLDKYVRLMPSIMVMVAIVILMPLTYRGPVWNDYVTKQSAVCQSTGWLNTVFLQNYLPYKEICLPQTWLICVEFQLVLLMAPIVYYLNKSYMDNFNLNNNYVRSSSSKLSGNSTAMMMQTKSRADASRLFYWLWTVPGAVLIVCVALGTASSFYNVFSNQLPPTWLYTMADPDSKALYFTGHLMRLWTHLAVFAMGILAGIECRRATRNIHRGYRTSNLSLVSISSSSSLNVNHLTCLGAIRNNNNNNNNNNSNNNNNNNNGSHTAVIHEPKSPSKCKYLEVIGYLVAITTMTTIIFSTHEWSLNDLPKPLIAGIFDAFSRFLWSLALIWMLYMVSVPGRNRKFSLFARSLGHPVMVCLGKLSFLIYIIHPIVHTAVLAIQEQPIYSSWLMLFHILIGNITITVILASLVSLFVEMPCRNLFRRCGTSLLLTNTITSTTAAASSSSAAATAAPSTT